MHLAIKTKQNKFAESIRKCLSNTRIINLNTKNKKEGLEKKMQWHFLKEEKWYIVL